MGCLLAPYDARCGSMAGKQAKKKQVCEHFSKVFESSNEEI